MNIDTFIKTLICYENIDVLDFYTEDDKYHPDEKVFITCVALWEDEQYRVARLAGRNALNTIVQTISNAGAVWTWARTSFSLSASTHAVFVLNMESENVTFRGRFLISCCRLGNRRS